MLYHYTDRLSLADIRREVVIRAQPQTLYRDILGANGKGPSLVTPAIIWLSINPVLDATVVGKLVSAGWPRSLVGDLCRVVLPAGYGGDLGLGEYTEAVGISPEWWEWVIRTGAMVGSHYTTWRIVDHDIPAGDWLDCETLAGFTQHGTRWRKQP